MKASDLKKDQSFFIEGKGWDEELIYKVLIPATENIKICVDGPEGVQMSGLAILAERETEEGEKDIICLSVTAEVWGEI